MVRDKIKIVPVNEIKDKFKFQVDAKNLPIDFEIKQFLEQIILINKLLEKKQ